MSLDTKVKNLIINTNMTKEQYEAIDDKSNQLFFVEDSSVVDVPAPEENQSGYLHTDGANLTWKEIESGDKLPDQTDNAGKFLTTDGTTASWGEALVNTAQYPSYQIAIGGTTTSSTTGNIVIGHGSSSSEAYSIAIGRNCKVSAMGSILLSALGNAPHVISQYAEVTEEYSFYVGLGSVLQSEESGLYKLLGADGTIPTDRYTTTPTATGTYVPKLTIAEDGTATREWAADQIGDISTALTAILGE